ncbi:MAG: DNA alkylation repair protein [Flavobacteriales bacterium]|nr:DNA alkylation repair protein [Flavobacteriales bacterium]
MAEPLKNRYNRKFIQGLADALSPEIGKFSDKDFVSFVIDKEWQEMELKQRMRRIAVALRKHIGGTYESSVPIIKSTIQRLRKQGVQNDMFEYMFFADYVEVYGQDHVDISMDAMEFITQFASCEFAIRPFIVKDPEKTMKRMLLWSLNKESRVRRLSSEGCRPRLPWAMALSEFKKNPKVILPILENLKSDESLSVRKSVANNLNDIAKDNPEVVIHILRKWQGKNELTDWILKHGCRTLLRNADPKVLGRFGMSTEVRCALIAFKLNAKEVLAGEKIELSFSLENRGDRREKYRVEYGVDFMKSDGKQKRKIFKITENQFEPRTIVSFTRKHTLADLTTRKHYSGRHNVVVLVNGNELGSKSFLLKGFS